jgi:acetylornithine deacetylase/succinyl-diaminopimelate desuccinylase-like protein
MLEAGHASNALPQSAKATASCRLLPGEDEEQVRKTLDDVLADDRIQVTEWGHPKPSPASPLRPDIVQAVERLSAQFWPGAIVMPQMVPGATTGNLLRASGIPTYGHAGLEYDFDEPSRMHGKDERIGIDAFYRGNEYTYRLVKMLAGGS